MMWFNHVLTLALFAILCCLINCEEEISWKDDLFNHKHKLHRSLLDAVTSGKTNHDIIVSVKPIQSHENVEKQIKKELHSCKNRTQKNKLLIDALKKNMEKSFIKINKVLKSRNSSRCADFIWVSSQILLKNACPEELILLAKLPEISKILPDIIIPYIHPVQPKPKSSQYYYFTPSPNGGLPKKSYYKMPNMPNNGFDLDNPYFRQGLKRNNINNSSMKGYYMPNGNYYPNGPIPKGYYTPGSSIKPIPSTNTISPIPITTKQPSSSPTLTPPPTTTPTPFTILPSTTNVPPPLQWGVQKINAKLLWDQGYKGQGIIVASIDSGVHATHESLRTNQLPDYGWFDPAGSLKPFDSQGHGTHTLGTIVGTTNGIGVAPDAQWMACRGCDETGCQASNLVKCGQWICNPTKSDSTSPDTSKIPHIVSNSWGGDSMEFFGEMINTWHTLGIIPVFAIGNDGPQCNTAKTPAILDNVISVGSTDIDDSLSLFSSRGPGVVNGVTLTKPDIVAPGGQIISASADGDNLYRESSGSSMACPHVTGAIALLLSQNKALTYKEVYSALMAGVVTSTLKTTGEKCNGIADNAFPNNGFGYGRIDISRVKPKKI